MVMWTRNLSKPEVLEALRDYLLKHNQIEEGDTVNSSTLGQISVQIIDAERPVQSVPAPVSFDKPADVDPVLADDVVHTVE